MKKEKVLKKLRTLGEKELQTWLTNLPDDEMIEATQILNDFAKSTPLYKTDSLYRKQIAESENMLQKFQDIVLKEKVQNLMHEVEIDAHMKKADAAYDNMRATLINEIIQNPEKTEELKKIIFGLIEIEKEHNLYEPEKWKLFLDRI